MLQVETDNGFKVLLKTVQEQRDYAKTVAEESLYCLLPHPEGWIVEMVTDSEDEAYTWWQNQQDALVYHGQTGRLKYAKCRNRYREAL